MWTLVLFEEKKIMNCINGANWAEKYSLSGVIQKQKENTLLGMSQEVSLYS